jgi:hypothetical protein
VAELDELLSTTLKRIAPPAESSGVADAVRARVEAGDAGISATSSTAPGWGGGGASGWLPWIGVVIVVGLVGGAVGVSGVAGAAIDETVVVGHTSVLDAVVDAGSCPGGPVVRRLSADTRVLAVARSEDSAYLGVRNPDDVAATIWVPASVVVPDDAAGLAALPVGDACPAGTLAPIVVVPVEPTPEPTKPEPPAVVPTPTSFSAFAATCTLITIKATDADGVSSVTVSVSGTEALTTTNMVLSKGTWKLNVGFQKDGNSTYTFTAVDGGGRTTTTSQSLNQLCGLI